jgi:hypothetical protein
MSYGPKAKLGFTATGTFDRRDYGMEMNIRPRRRPRHRQRGAPDLDVEADLPQDDAP